VGFVLGIWTYPTVHGRSISLIEYYNPAAFLENLTRLAAHPFTRISNPALVYELHVTYAYIMSIGVMAVSSLAITPLLARFPALAPLHGALGGLIGGGQRKETPSLLGAPQSLASHLARPSLPNVCLSQAMYPSPSPSIALPPPPYAYPNPHHHVVPTYPPSLPVLPWQPVQSAWAHQPHPSTLPLPPHMIPQFAPAFFGTGWPVARNLSDSRVDGLRLQLRDVEHGRESEIYPSAR